jgi:hypothetical protein
MKTTITLLSIALLALTTTLFGRMGEPEADCNCCPEEIFMDQDLSMEEWMSEPFEVYFESELSLESWMLTPFESTENVEVEQWMAAAWF